MGTFVEALDKNRAFAFERFEHETVVDDLMAHVERAPVGAQRAAHRLDRAIDAGAKAARLSQDDLFDRCFAQRHLAIVTGYCPQGQ